MKFIMVVIICFGADCQAIFEQTFYNTKEQCLQVAMETTAFMRDAYPTSSGEIHCFNEEEFKLYNQYLQNGGKPSLNPPQPSSDV
jgi:hypothetical protein